MEYIKCMINDNYNPSQAALSCTQEVDTVDWAAVSACARGGEGNVLHKLAGDKTHQLRPRVIAVLHRTDIFIFLCLKCSVFSDAKKSDINSIFFVCFALDFAM